MRTPLAPLSPNARRPLGVPGVPEHVHAMRAERERVAARRHRRKPAHNPVRLAA